MYIAADLITEGALDTSTTFSDQSSLDQWVEEMSNEARLSGRHMQVFVMHHEHNLNQECECAQYVTDHNPAFEWNAPE